MTSEVKPLHQSKKQVEPAWTKELEAILDAYSKGGGNVEDLKKTNVATLVVSSNRVLLANEIPGIHFEAEELPQGVRALINVEPGAVIEKTVHLCFGMIPAEGIQEIIAEYNIGAGAKVEFLAHCAFPNAIRLTHLMNAKINVGQGARMAYKEAHYHGTTGGVEVVPRAEVNVEERAHYLTTFSLTHGRLGKLEIDYDVTVGKNASAELITKAYGFGDDQVIIKETLHLNGEGARGLTKTRAAVKENAKSEVYTTAEGNAPFARGHMDCTEIIQGNAIAKNVPVVIVRDERAQVTHEAAIGTVNHKELETLMARGLSQEEAVDIIIRGMLQE